MASEAPTPPPHLFYGLDLTSEEDRAIFRQRVADHYKMMKAVNVLLERKAITGLVHSTTRDTAIRSIADFWIKAFLAKKEGR